MDNTTHPVPSRHGRDCSICFGKGRSNEAAPLRLSRIDHCDTSAFTIIAIRGSCLSLDVCRFLDSVAQLETEPMVKLAARPLGANLELGAAHSAICHDVKAIMYNRSICPCCGTLVPRYQIRPM